MTPRDHLADVLKKHLESADLEPGRVHHIELRHSSNCGHWKGEACDCQPSIVSGPPIDQKHGAGE
ncbi:MAG: hypothetical protein ABL963_12250 [Longimicrobiales bacterium]